MQGHVGWLFAGSGEFEGRASTFLAEGLRHRERLMYVADDPNTAQWPKSFALRGDLVILSTSEVYGPERLVDAASQRATYEVALAEALHDGYNGIRVAADNTSLIANPQRLSAWLEWEVEAERFIAENPLFTGLCAFDRTRANAEDLQTVVSVHREMALPAP